MRSSRSGSRRLGPLLLFCVLALLPPAARCAGIEVRQAQIVAADAHWVLDAEFHIDLGNRIEEVVAHGVPLYFLTEFTLSKPRWYWADEHVAGNQQSWRLSYNALTRQYRLATGELHQNFASLAEALAVLARLRNWVVAERGALLPGEHYSAALRMKLDMSRLPKPFQIGAIGNRDWTLATPILRWEFVPTTEAAEE